MIRERLMSLYEQAPEVIDEMLAGLEFTGEVVTLKVDGLRETMVYTYQSGLTDMLETLEGINHE